MEKVFIKDLAPGEEIISFFLVQRKQVAKKRNNEDYMRLHLSDRTGFIPAVMWDNVESIKDTFERDDVVKIQGVPGYYQDTLQIVIRKLRRAEDDEINLEDYFPVSETSIEEMGAQLKQEINSVKTPYLNSLLENIFQDEKIMAAFSRAPAGQNLHHVYIGGLFEHTLSMTKIARFLAEHLGNVDMDLVITGSLLHDIGKIRELKYNRSFGYTDEGRLIGHITIGLDIIRDKINLIEGFPNTVKLSLEHLVISHHGQFEWGSPKLPMTLEALIIHYADDVDSKFNCFLKWIRENPDQSNPDWTTYSKQLERYLFSGHELPGNHGNDNG